MIPAAIAVCGWILIGYGVFRGIPSVILTGLVLLCISVAMVLL